MLSLHSFSNSAKRAIVIAFTLGAVLNGATPCGYTHANKATRAAIGKNASSDKPGAIASEAASRQPRLAAGYGKLPLSFEANQGQHNAQIKFSARGRGYNLSLAGDKAVLALDLPSPSKTAPEKASPAAAQAVVQLKLVHAKAQPNVTGLDELPNTSNYFLGNDPALWKTDIPNFARVKYEDVYPGIDLIYYGNQGQLEYDLVVAPEADPRRIKLSYAGTRQRWLDKQGNLVLLLDQGSRLIQHKPLAYQIVAGRRQSVASRYVLAANREVRIEVGAYDRHKPLVIDPVLSYSTYLFSEAGGVAVDASGNAYVVGYTVSGLPLVNPAQATYGGGAKDLFVQKFNATGTALVYSTYLGGSDDDSDAGLGRAGIAVDSAGNAYVVTTTLSTNYPVVNAVQPAHGTGVQDIAVSKLNAAGTALVYSTYLGGFGSDRSGGIAVDATGKAYVIGHTISPNFPVLNALQATKQGTAFAEDLTVTVYNAAGSGYVYSTYLGGANTERSRGIAVDSTGNAYLVGYTNSTNFPVVNAVQASLVGSNYDALVAKLNPSGSALVYSTYLGGSGADFGNAVAVDASGNAYLTGSTPSADFPVANPYQVSKRSGNDAFVTKLPAAGAPLTYSTFLGSNGTDNGQSIAVDSGGSAYVTGDTTSGATGNFPLVNQLQAFTGTGSTTDAFLTRFDSAGNTVSFSTAYGGNNNDTGLGVAVSAPGEVFLAGSTTSTSGLPLFNPLYTTGGGFLVKFNLNLSYYTISGQAKDAANNAIAGVTMTLSGGANQSVQTDTGGNYSFPSLPGGSNYTVTPTKAGYIFTPASSTFNNLSANQTANFTGLTVAITGRVTNGASAGVAGITVTLSGSQAATTQTDANGDYLFGNLTSGGNYTVTPSKTDPFIVYSFAPANRTYANLTGVQTGADFTMSTTISATLSPLADAYVKDGASASTNFGTATPMLIQTDSVANSGNNKDVYFKFDLAPVAGNITLVKLRFYAMLAAAGSVGTSAYSVANVSWIESGSGSLTWSNKPALSGSPLNVTPVAVTATSLTLYEIDVTNYVRAEKIAGRDVVSLALHNSATSTLDIILNAREEATNRPTLYVQTSTALNSPPTVSLTSPANGASFTAPASIALAATASDSDGAITKVEFFAGANLLGTDTTSPYNFTWNNVAAGSYALTAVATDNSGAITTSSTASVTVSNANGAPTVALAAPLNNTTFGWGANLTLSATASDADGTISKVEFFQGATLIGTATTPTAGNSYSVAWNNVAPGAHALTAKATDNSNAVTTSGTVNLNVVRHTGLSPTADAYVRDGASATTNFGTAIELDAQANATAGNNRQSYLTFSLASVSNIARARIRLYGRLSDTSGTNVPAAIYSVATTSWVETTINWNNKPAPGASALATVTVTDNVARWYEWDVTAYAQAEKAAGRNTISFAVKNTANSSPYALFNSREATTNRPELNLQVTNGLTALFVAASTTLNSSESALRTRLQNLGFTVTVKASNTSLVTADADGRSLVVISSTVTPANVTNKFKFVAVPVLNWRADLFDDFGMTGTPTTEYGTTASQTQVAITNAAHPMAAGLSGTVTAVTAASNFTWGKPNANAAKIATQAGDATKNTIFGYDTGAAMPGLEAPARRVGFFLTDTNGVNLNASGNALFDAAVKWVAETIAVPTVFTLSPTLGLAGTTVTITGCNFGATQGTSVVAFNGRPASVSVWADKSLTASVPANATTGPVTVTVNGVVSNGLIFAVGEVDSDGDGLADSWELLYFGNLSQTAGGDFDGDGLTNLQEFQLGRNPTKGAIADNGVNVNLKVFTPLLP